MCERYLKNLFLKLLQLLCNVHKTETTFSSLVYTVALNEWKLWAVLYYSVKMAEKK